MDDPENDGWVGVTHVPDLNTQLIQPGKLSCGFLANVPRLREYGNAMASVEKTMGKPNKFSKKTYLRI